MQLPCLPTCNRSLAPVHDTPWLYSSSVPAAIFPFLFGRRASSRIALKWRLTLHANSGTVEHEQTYSPLLLPWVGDCYLAIHVTLPSCKPSRPVIGCSAFPTLYYNRLTYHVHSTLHRVCHKPADNFVSFLLKPMTTFSHSSATASILVPTRPGTGAYTIYAPASKELDCTHSRW